MEENVVVEHLVVWDHVAEGLAGEEAERIRLQLEKYLRGKVLQEVGEGLEWGVKYVVELGVGYTLAQGGLGTGWKIEVGVKCRAGSLGEDESDVGLHEDSSDGSAVVDVGRVGEAGAGARVEWGGDGAVPAWGGFVGVWGEGAG